MAPTSEDVSTIKASVDRLEQRVRELEARLQGKASGDGGAASSAGTSMRMILMGPPGAGMCTILLPGSAEQIPEPECDIHSTC